MLQRIASNADALTEVKTMDAISWSEDNDGSCVDQGLDAYIATVQLSHGQTPRPHASRQSASDQELQKSLHLRVVLPIPRRSHLDDLHDPVKPHN